MFNVKKNKKGFTLVELMVVVVIIGILTAIAIPVYNSVTKTAEKNTCQANQRSIESAIQVYLADGGSFSDITDVAYLTEQHEINAAHEGLEGPWLADEPKCPTSGESYTIGDDMLVICGTECAAAGHSLH